MNYTKGNIGASGKWEASGNNEIIGIRDAVTLSPICFIKPVNWDIAHLIVTAPDMYKVLGFANNQIKAWCDFCPELKPYVFAAQTTIQQVLAKAGGKQ